MAGGRPDRSIGIHIHDIQVTESKYLFEGAQIIVHQLQQLICHGHHIGEVLVIGSAPGGNALIGHGDKVDIFHLQSAENSLLGKP